MQKNITVCPFVLIIYLLLTCGPALANLASSPHNLAYGGTFQGDNPELCVYCHTPHGGISHDTSGNAVPLWNRSLYEYETFQMYTSPTMVATLPTKPRGTSLMCLSCHDGVSSLGAVINNSMSQATINMNYDPMNYIEPFLPPWKKTIIGRDLRDDHPISFAYTPQLVTDEQTAHGVQGLNAPDDEKHIGSLRLYNYYVECSTCHDAHENSIAGQQPFLRMSNANSGMCLTCHRK